MASPVGLMWGFPMIKDGEHRIVRSVATGIPGLEKYLLKSFAHI